MARRFLTLPFMLFGISIISFLLLDFAPGDVAEITLRRQNQGITPSFEAISAFREDHNLNAPIHIRYLHWLTDALRGDFGESYRSGDSISHELSRRLPATILLTLSSLFFAILIGIPLGVFAAIKQGSLLDSFSRLLALWAAAIPSYVVALLLMLLFSVHFNWLPSIGYGSPKHLILPTLALSFGTMALFMRLIRASMLEVLNQQYIVAARSKGLSEPKIIIWHAFKNSLLPVVTVVGTSTGYLLSGAVIIETIFGWPGVGQFVIVGITQRDYPVVQAFVIYIAIVFLLVNLLVDIVYRFLDPRLHFEAL